MRLYLSITAIRPGKSYIKGTFRLENGQKSTLAAVNLLSECGPGIMATALSRAFRQCAGQWTSSDICKDACCHFYPGHETAEQAPHAQRNKSRATTKQREKADCIIRTVVKVYGRGLQGHSRASKCSQQRPGDKGQQACSRSARLRCAPESRPRCASKARAGAGGVVACVWGWLGVLQLLSSLSRVHINEPRWCVVHTDASRATSTWRHEIHATVER